MISKLLKIQRLAQKEVVLQRFNATLPILLEVLKKTKANHYLLKVGHQVLETKSLKPLEIGGRYFALMKSGNQGGITLSSLRPEPKIAKIGLDLMAQDLKDFSFDGVKENLLQEMSLARHKDEFLSYGMLLFGLQKGILSFCVNDEGKEVFLQTRKEKNKIEFYAIFPHLGEIEGGIFEVEHQKILELNVAYESVALFLKNFEDLLSGFHKICIGVQDKITPLFSPQEQLLDLKI